MDAKLYLIVGGTTPRATIDAAVAGGVDLVQLRDKRLDDDAFLARAQELARHLDVPLVLNDRWHLFEESGADGVHVGQDDAPIEQVRRALGPGALLGLSTHDRAEALAARARGADYIGLGPMYPTETKALTYEPRGAALVREAIDATDLPVFPIGGIDAERLPALVEAGARRACVSRAILGADDPQAAAEALRRALTRF
ncbi:MAG: thiamine phosphate synthase [Planctomycetota bacterium]